MSPILQQLIYHLWSREVYVPISACVHYCGFRYGRNEFNPYENYAVAFAHEAGREDARTSFEDFLKHYRPVDFAEGLGLALDRRYPLWLYPWEKNIGVEAWRLTHQDCPDILTHFSRTGISRAMVEQEYRWLEGALVSIREHGFQPRRFRSTIQARCFRRSDGTRAYLLLDGNHRVSALYALGHQKVPVRYMPRKTVLGSDAKHWPLVVRGTYTLEDARRVFEVYFEGNHRPRTTDTPTSIVE